MAREVFSVVFAAAVAALGALILGEYPYDGLLVVVSAILLGLFVGEAYVWKSRRRGAVGAGICAGLTAAGLLWGGWISTGHNLGSVAGWGWVAMVVGAAAAAVRAGWPAPADTRPAPAPSE